MPSTELIRHFSSYMDGMYHFTTCSVHTPDPSPQPYFNQNRFAEGTEATPQKCFTCHEKLSGAIPFLILLCMGQLLGNKYQLFTVHSALKSQGNLQQKTAALGDLQIHISSNPSGVIRPKPDPQATWSARPAALLLLQRTEKVPCSCLADLKEK